MHTLRNKNNALPSKHAFPGSFMQTATIIFTVFGITQGLFFAFLLLSLRKNAYGANPYLAALAGILSLTLVMVFLHFTGLSTELPHLLGFTQYLPLLYGPLLLFYISKFADSAYEFKTLRLLHFLPFAILLLDDLPFLLISAELKRSYANNLFVDAFRPRLDFNSLVPMLHFLVYVLLSYRVYRGGKRRVSDRNAIATLRWIRNIIAASAAIWAVYFLLYLISLDALNLSIPILLSLTLFAMGNAGFKRPELFRRNGLHKARYEASRLSLDDKERYGHQLQELMQEHKLYMHPTLSLAELAQQMKLSAHEVSQIINQEFEQNFSDFVNRFRVEEAKEKLKDPRQRHLTITGIGLEVGFNSKSAFYSAFRKYTGQSPTEFVKSSAS